MTRCGGYKSCVVHKMWWFLQVGGEKLVNSGGEWGEMVGNLVGKGRERTGWWKCWN